MARPPFQNEHQYAVDQEVMRHDDAVHYFGEMTACIMLWSIHDFTAGRVGRCSLCYLAYGEIAEAYEQPARYRCSSCYGTTFEGGLRALIFRPAIWAEDMTSEDLRQRGVTAVSSGSVQITSDFNMRDGDFLVRQDGSRWRISQPQVSEVNTGFGPTGTQRAPGSMFRVQMEDRSSVVFTIPVPALELESVGWSPVMIYPTASDVVNGPLEIDDWADAPLDFGPSPTETTSVPIYDGGAP